MFLKRLIIAVSLSLTLTAQDQNIFYKDADIKTFAQDIALLTDKTYPSLPSLFKINGAAESAVNRKTPVS